MTTYPAANELTAMVPSNTVRKFITDHDITCSDFEKVCMIINNPFIVWDDRKRYLSQILNSLSSKVDSESQHLASQIKTYLQYFTDGIRDFKVNTNKEFVYVLKFEDDSDRPYSLTPYSGIFTDFNTAYEAGVKDATDFAIEKASFQKKPFYPLSDKIMLFNSHGYIMSYFDPKSRPFNDSVTYYKNIDRAYCSIVNPFERGDMVRVVGSEKVGIVETTSEEWSKTKQQYLSHIMKIHGKYVTYSDAVIKVSFVTMEGTFHAEHINPLYLHEYVASNDNANNQLLTCAHDVYTGKRTLSELCFYMEKYKEDRERELY